MTPQQLLFYCRAGFEQDLSAELTDKSAALGWAGYPLAISDSGYVRFVVMDDAPANLLHRQLPLEGLIFARQSLVALDPLEDLSREDRLTPIIDQVVESGWSFESVWQETPDTNDAKTLAGLTRALERPLISQLKKRGALRRKAGGRRLHAFWTAGDCVQLAMSFPGNRSEHPGGILRLRSPRDAPSRSTLKLEEAWHTFIPKEEWGERLNETMQAADLGAAPGGWTYQLVKQGMHVYAIDNGPMDSSLMRTGQVDHHKEDAFSWKPVQRLDWLVCDIVDKPARVTALMAHWLTRHWCREAIFNLKLPMKKRWPELEGCLRQLDTALTQSQLRAEIRCRHLYHDRDEVTAYVRLLD
ncbi:23S rRNA (cytidine(2498)-2'-O)-methyltransferase RlmM [Aidingimonas halophila]|uniref:Ribosomal RNA large subunit methyltransferase M n=1 Tax=Aidingimonas halophila TaxID=574349 RepID=A0A1H3DNI9_9GAMM|nr:23S rRNA (cytidine(2498)-2'-O)-methyltransferase RlmM [Aidingimonas halophila]GHC29611.1 ribosomal RNA large subunit methyltransferase M [Aidingimonas halophila]SDX67658.1 23S rRNA (cytidine2498-2'-O)-methyltransferase [Aidingimonas halophila]